jgi:hypothetical protein
METNVNIDNTTKKDWIAPEITLIQINGFGGAGFDFASEVS